MRRRHLLAAWALAAAVGLSGCGYLAGQSAASVGDATIPLDRLQKALAAFRKTSQFKQLSSQSTAQQAARQFEQGYLSNMIREQVIRDAARRMGITASDAAVQQRIEQIKSNYATDKQFEQAVSAQGLTLGQLDKLVRDQVLQDQIRARVTKDVSVPDSKVASYYRSHRSDFTLVHVAHITFPADDFKTALETYKKVTAAPVAQRKELFGRFAKKHSLDTASAAKGGDVGELPLGRLDSRIAGSLGALDPGEVSHPVNTPNGWEVFLLIDRHLQPLGRVSDQIRGQLVAKASDAAWQRWLSARYEALGVAVNPRFGELDPTTLQVADPKPQDRPLGAKPVPHPAMSGRPIGPGGAP